MLSKRGNTITEQNVDYTLSLTFEEKEGQMAEMDRDFICHTINGRPIKPKTLGQKSYVDEIRKKMIVFGVGPAGTGKTYLAIAMAVTAFKNDEVGKIILTRQLKLVKNWDFYQGICKVKLTHIFVHCMTHCIRLWDRKVLQKIWKKV